MSKLQAVVAVLVTVVWAVTLLVGLYRNDYSGATAVTPVMLIVVGFIFANNAVKALTGKRNGNGGGGE